MKCDRKARDALSRAFSLLGKHRVSTTTVFNHIRRLRAMSHAAACADITSRCTKIDSHPQGCPSARAPFLLAALIRDAASELKQLQQYDQTTSPTAARRQATRAVKPRTIADTGVEVRWLVHHLAHTLHPEFAFAADNRELDPARQAVTSLPGFSFWTPILAWEANGKR
jgi:hypothetical protein